MLNRLRVSLGLQLARFRFRKRRDDLTAFTNAVSAARSALVILPFAPDAELPDQETIERLRRALPADQTTVVTNQGEGDARRIFPRGTVVRIAERDFTWLMLPRRAALDRVTRRPFDVAIDLNLDFVLAPAYICRESNAAVRIGFTGKRADLFYNFQIQRDPARSAGRPYAGLAACLRMF